MTLNSVWVTLISNGTWSQPYWKKLTKFSQTFYTNYLGIFKQVAHFSVGIQGLWCVKTYLLKTGGAFFLYPQDFPFPCLLVAQNVSITSKKNGELYWIRLFVERVRHCPTHPRCNSVHKMQNRDTELKTLTKWIFQLERNSNDQSFLIFSSLNGLQFNCKSMAVVWTTVLVWV